MSVVSIDMEKKSSAELTYLASRGNKEAKCEIGLRCLSGVWGMEKDDEKAWKYLTESATESSRAKAVIGEMEELDYNTATLNAGKWYADNVLDIYQLPGNEETKKTLIGLASFWFATGADNSSPECPIALGEFYYDLGGSRYHAAAEIFSYCVYVPGLKEKSIDRLLTMISNGWMKPDWNCYPDTVQCLEEEGIDVSEWSDSVRYDDLIDYDAAKVVEEAKTYPIAKVKEGHRSAGTGVDRTGLKYQLNKMGVKASPRRNGFAFPIRGHEEDAEYLKKNGYRVTEERYNYIVYEKK